MTLTTDILLHAYANGVFPMAETRNTTEIFWVDPKKRGIFPLDQFHISRSLARVLRKDIYRVTANNSFAAVVEGCANREETWINDEIFERYIELHEQGYAHSIEVWDGFDLIGGVYGVSLGGAFFGESMFSRRTNASKIALAYLTDRLNITGYQLCDTQFLTPHLASLGAVEICRATYRELLKNALAIDADFTLTEIPTGQELLQRNTQIS